MRTLMFAACLALTPGFVYAAETVEKSATSPARGQVTGIAATPITLTRATDDDADRRCVFLGRCGSFTLIGAEGTAAYLLGRDEYIADLVAAGEDENWWLYRVQGNGDPQTSMWAFARKPHCGKYRVLKYSNGAWRVFEDTRAWGAGLGNSRRFAAATSEPSNQELLDKLRQIEGKLNAIQPGGRPSLSELEQQLKKQP